MTSKLVVNTIEADTGISSVSFGSSISMSSTSKFHFSAAGIDIDADTNINRPSAGVLGFNINGAEKFRIDTNGHLNTSGIVTAANFKSGVTNVHNLGVTLTGGQLDVGSNIKIGTAGVVTATSFVGTGSVIAGDTSNNAESGADDLVVGNTSGEHGITIFSGTTSAGTIFFGDGTGVNNRRGAIRYLQADDAFQFNTNGNNEKLRIASSGQIGLSGANYGSSGQVLTSQGSSSAPVWATPSSGVTVSGNVDNRVITGDGTNLVGESQLEFLSSTGGNSILRATAPEGGDAEFHLRADENDDAFDRYKLVSGADNHFQMYQMGAGGGWESRVKFHSERGNIEPIYDPLGLHGGGVTLAMANTNSGSQSDSPNFKVDFTVPMADINTIKRNGAREGFAASGETGSTINPHGGSGILIASSFGNYYWGFATKIYHISCYGSYSSGTAVSLNQLHSFTGSGHGANSSHITLSVQSNPANTKTTPTLRATFGGDYWSANYLVVTYVGSGVASYANLRSLSHINSVITGQDTSWK